MCVNWIGISVTARRLVSFRAITCFEVNTVMPMACNNDFFFTHKDELFAARAF